MWLKALFQTHLDLSVKLSPTYRAHVYERPGCWMSPDDCAALASALRDVAQRSLVAGALDYGVFRADSGAFERSVIMLIRERTSGRPVAFNALALLDVDHRGRRDVVTHLGLVLIDPQARGKGFSWALYGMTTLLLFARNQLRPFWISSVTQVPAVVGLVCEGFSDVFPAPGDGVVRRFDHLSLAREIMRSHRAAFGVSEDAPFDDERFVIKDAYRGGSDHLKKRFDQAPPHRDPAFNAFCADQLDYARGDDLLQIGQMNLAAARRYLLQDVPRHSLPGLVGALLFLLVQRAVLPALYWLSPGRAWGRLRPWRERRDV
jgi:GNAT superfamily N-acetyltransferase